MADIWAASPGQCKRVLGTCRLCTRFVCRACVRSPGALVLSTLLDENERLKRRAERQTAIIRLLVVLLKVSRFRLDEQRFPDGKAKDKVLRAVERSKNALALKSALGLVRLSPARYHAWKRADKRCELDDRSSCPRSHPTQLTPAEVSTIKDMVTATEYRHMPLRTLSLYAQRAGHVFASATTWARLARQRGWRRPRHPPYACPGRGRLQQFHDRGILAFSTSPMALPAFTRKLHPARTADRFLRQRAQRRNAAQRV